MLKVVFRKNLVTSAELDHKSDKPDQLVVPKDNEVVKSDKTEIDYAYFKEIVRLTSLSGKKGSVKMDARVVTDSDTTESSPSDSETKVTVAEPPGKLTKNRVARHIKPKPPTKSASLVPYVNENETLQRLVKMKINLSEVEKHAEAANFVVRADFEQDITTRLFLLKHLGVDEGKLAAVISKHPALLVEDGDHMQVCHMQV